MLDPTKIRADFPILHQQVNGKPLVYLDNAATAQKPKAVIDALSRFYERDNSNVHRGLHVLSMRSTEAYEGARTRVAKFINAADPAELIFTRGTTESINLVARELGRRQPEKGDVILLTEMEHHSNLVPWQMIARRTGATLRYVPVRRRKRRGRTRPWEARRPAHARGQALRLHAHFQLARGRQPGRRPLRPGARPQHHHRDRWRAVHRAPARRRARPRLRFLRFLRPQDGGRHRHRRALRPPRAA
jgi:hypothetical protein